MTLFEVNTIIEGSLPFTVVESTALRLARDCPPKLRCLLHFTSPVTPVFGAEEWKTVKVNAAWGPTWANLLLAVASAKETTMP